jgi:hypothetical protein
MVSIVAMIGGRQAALLRGFASSRNYLCNSESAGPHFPFCQSGTMVGCQA